MPGIILRAFSGEQPRIIPRLMPENAAQEALNTRLDDGALTPMRRPTVEATMETGLQTIYRHNGAFLGWETVVNAAPGPVAQDRLYYTGDGVPKMKVGDDIYPLAVPPPSAALTAALTGDGDGDVITRIYVYTWVTSLGEESEPSPASNAVDWQPGHTTTLSGFAETPADRAITKQRIYRSQTGQVSTGLFLIAERDASEDDFVDTVAIDDFQEVIPSIFWNAPPDNLAGLISLPNGMMAGFVGRDLYFCEPYRPHAWPERYVLTTEYPIVGLGAIGTSMLVMTTGMPYIVNGSSPDTMQMAKVEQNLPCINARGIVDLGYAIAYPSHEGLVAYRGDGSIGLVTGNIFSRDEWLKHNPGTMIGGQISGRYVAFYSYTDQGTPRTGALILDLSGQSFLIRSNATADAAFFEIGSGALYYLARNSASVKRLDPPAGARETQYWKSKKFILPYPENFGAILIDAGVTTTEEEQVALEALIEEIETANAALVTAGLLFGAINEHEINAYPLGGDAQAPVPPPLFNSVNIGVYADDERVATISGTSRMNRPVRLPAGSKARTWEIDVFANIRIESIVIAKTVDELKQAG